MGLGHHSRRLDRRLRAIEAAINKMSANGAPSDRLERWAMQDGYLSHAWQAWGVFCRELIFSSARGALTANASPSGSPHAARPDEELAFIGQQAAHGNPINAIRPISAMRNEPTWGDINKFTAVVQAYSLLNEGTVLSGVLSAGQVVRHMQTIRNATAHTNTETFSAVRALATFYVASPIVMPGDAIFWTDPNSGDYIYREWTNRMIAAANLAVA